MKAFDFFQKYRLLFRKIDEWTSNTSFIYIGKLDFILIECQDKSMEEIWDSVDEPLFLLEILRHLNNPNFYTAINEYLYDLLNFMTSQCQQPYASYINELSSMLKNIIDGKLVYDPYPIRININGAIKYLGQSKSVHDESTQYQIINAAYAAFNHLIIEV